MSEWKEVALGDVIQLQRGFDLTEKEVDPGPYPVISSGGVSYSTSTPKLEGPGVVTGRKGVLGKVHYSPGPYWPHDTTLWVKDFKGNEPHFVYYWLQTLPLASLDAGAANPTLNRNHAHLIRVRVPDPRTQARIAQILGAIDDLIENNRRRIALLERMAQAIHWEWFVHFRYPGHEDDELVDSPLGPIPAGWEVVRLGDVLELRYGKALKAEARRGGSVAVVGSSGVVGWHDESLVDGPVVIVGRKGNVGSVTWVPGDAWPIDTTYFVVTDLPLDYVYRLLLGAEFIDSHAAVPGLGRDQAYALDVVRPPLQVLRRFEDVASRLMSLSVCLRQEAGVLVSVRDALLPKLVTGAIDVSHLDLDALLEEPAA